MNKNQIFSILIALFIIGFIAFKITPQIQRIFDQIEFQQKQILDLKTKIATFKEKGTAQKHIDNLEKALITVQRASRRADAIYIRTGIFILIFISGFGYLFLSKMRLKKEIIAKKSMLKQIYFDDFSTDRIGENIDWSPLTSGGSNTLTSRIHKINNSKYKVKNTAIFKTFTHLFILTGLLFFMYDIYAFHINFGIQSIDFMKGLNLIFNVGGIFMVIGLAVSFFLSFNTLFDLQKRIVISEQKVDFRDIHAIQILSKTISNTSGSRLSTFISYELNLVLKNETRVSVLGHGSYDMILHDAQLIKNFLHVPIWAQ